VGAKGVVEMASIESGGVATRPQMHNSDGDRRTGLIAAFGTYASWGFFPLLFRALEGVDPINVVANRIVWSFILVGGVLIGRHRMGEVRDVLGDWRSLRGIIISSVLLAINWLTFVSAVNHEKVLEVSFGYFITPLVSIAIGMVLLGERMNRWQKVSIGIAVIGVIIQALGLSGMPLVSLQLALSFGFYGYFRKTVNVGSIPGLFIETMVLLPVALAYMGYSFVTGGGAEYADPWTFSLLLLTGPATSGALIMFAYAARRLPLSTMGMFQYIAPSIHFLMAIWLFGEALNMVQLLSFVMIWVSLAVYSHDSYQRGRRARAKASHG